MAMTDFTIIRRSMRARLFSTVTTIITVAVAVGLMLVLLSMHDSGKKAFERGGGNMHMLVSADTDPTGAILNGVFYARAPRNFIPWARYQQIAGAFPLEYAVPTQQGDSFKGFPVLGTTEEFFSKFSPDPKGARWVFDQGRPFAADFEAVLGSEVARATGLKIGDKAVLTHGTGDSRAAGHVHEAYKYTIVGILKANGTAHDRAVFTSLESAWILHAHDRHELMEEQERAAAKARGEKIEEEDPAHEPALTRADLVETDKMITGIYIRVITREGSNASAVSAQVFDQLRRQSGITVAQPKQEIDKLFGIVSNIDQILLAMAGVVMVSSGIGIMLALYNSMEQRRRQIAVLRVLGCSRPRVFGLVVTESSMLGLIGAATGVIVAIVGQAIVTQVMKQRLGLVIDAAIPVKTALLVVWATVFLAALAGVIPAIMAYRTAVAKNLKPLV